VGKRKKNLSNRYHPAVVGQARTEEDVGRKKPTRSNVVGPSRDRPMIGVDDGRGKERSPKIAHNGGL